jgi:hypothetical protein
MTLEAQIVTRPTTRAPRPPTSSTPSTTAELWSDGGPFSRRSWQLGRQVWRRTHDWD